MPVAAFAWCIQAMSVPPSAAGEDAEVSRWIGNVGLMDLDEVKRRKGGWIASELTWAWSDACSPLGMIGFPLMLVGEIGR